jgi:hypothetical protein
MPKFVLKPKATTEDSSKKMCLDSTQYDKSDPKLESENKKPVEESSKVAPNGLETLCATYDSDESE